MFQDSSLDDLQQGAGGSPSTIARMVQAGGCPLFADMLARNGNGDSRELWNNMLLLTAYAEDGRAMAHMLSSGDPRYTAAETDAEFDMKLADRDKLGPTTCDTFSRCSNVCLNCPHLGKIKSPIVLGREKPAEVVPLVAARADPTWVDGGRTWTWTRSAEGEPERTMIFDMAMDRPVLIDLPGDARLELTFRGPGRVRVIIVESSRIQSRDYLPSRLGGDAIHYPKHLQRIVEGVFMAWTTLLRNENTTVDAPAFGWSDNGFSLCGDLFTSAGEVKRVGIMHDNVVGGYGVKGDPEPWQNLAAEIIADPRTELQILLATAFAAPLIHFTELSSTTMVIRSPESGVGKTTVMKLARSVYGDPEDMAQATDTPMAVEMKLSMLTDMAWYWDEVKVVDAKKLADTIYQIMQGKSKARGRPDGGLRSVSKTHGMLVMATNLSIREVMQEEGKGTDAGGLRVFEMDLPARVSRNADQVFNALVGKLGGNYGHVGRSYAAYLATHRAQVEDTVAKVGSFMTTIGFDLKEQERYWATTMKVVIAGAILANAAGLCTFDVERMVRHFKKLFDAMRTVSIEHNAPEELAARMWRFFANRCMITAHYRLTPGKPPPSLPAEMPAVPQTGHPRVRLAYMSNVLLIAKEGVKEYALSQRHQPELYYDAIARISKHHRGTMDQGFGTTGSRSGREEIYVLNASDVIGVDEVQEWVTSVAIRAGASRGSSSGSAPSGSTVP